jgi:hypothetical protein
MQTEESSTSIIQLSPRVYKKLLIIKEELGAQDLDAVIDKSLNIAHFVNDTLDDPAKKLLVEERGKYRELKEFP